MTDTPKRCLRLCRSTTIASTDVSRDVEKHSENKDDGHPVWLVVSAALVTLGAGLMCNLAVKLQNRQKIPLCDGCEEKYFDQPWQQTFIMFAGEAICILFYLADRYLIVGWRKRHHGHFEFPRPADLEKRITPFWWWIFPSILDLGGTAIVNMAFTMTYVSTVQMLRNSILVLTSMWTLLLMRRALRGHEWLGILILTCGLVAAGVQAILDPEVNTNLDPKKAWLGVILTLCGTVINGLQLIVEEWFFKRSYSHPMRAQGLEGLFGLAMNIPVIAIVHAVGEYNFFEGWYQMNHSAILKGAVLWYLIVVFLFNVAGLILTFVSNGLLRGVIYSLRAPILFVIEMCIGWQSYSNGQLAGLILSAVGFLVYSYLLGINERRLPKAHRILRKRIPCLCTRADEHSDTESHYDEEKKTTSNITDNV